MGKKLFAVLFCFLTIILAAVPASGKIVQYPAWYNMSLDINSPLRLDQPVTITVSIESFLGNLKDTRVRLIPPDSWNQNNLVKTIALIKAGEKKKIEFVLTPKSYLDQGSIVSEAIFNVPFEAIAAKVKEDFPDRAEGMISGLSSWPKVSKRYSEISFALLKEEAIFPLGKAIWRTYYDELAPDKGFRGPVFYDDPVISAYQAQTDVEMFQKLINYTTADPSLAQKLAESGVDINKKRYDQLNGLYVLATKSFLNGNLDQAQGFIEQFEKEIIKIDSEFVENLEIAALNLKAIIFWSKNQKRLAQEFLKKAFYKNRKHDLQRYVLRNIGLLMLANNEKATAEHMMKLGLSISPGYTLLEKELEKVRNH
jgi:hypothetical protein